MPTAETPSPYATELNPAALQAGLVPETGINDPFVAQIEAPAANAAEQLPGHDLEALAAFRRTLQPPHEAADAAEATAADPDFKERTPGEQALIETVTDLGSFTTKESGINPPPGKIVHRRWTEMSETHLEEREQDHTGQLPPFVISNEGRSYSEGDQIAARENLSGLADDLLLNFPNDAIVYRDPIYCTETSAVRLEDTSGEVPYYIEAVSRKASEEAVQDPSRFPVREVFLMAGDEKTKGADVAIYRVYVDGSVRRWDTVSNSETQNQIEAGVQESFEEIESMGGHLIEPSLTNVVIEGKANAELASEMGVNNLPVGPTEIDDLRKMLMRPTVGSYTGEDFKRGLIPPPEVLSAFEQPPDNP